MTEARANAIQACHERQKAEIEACAVHQQELADWVRARVVKPK